MISAVESLFTLLENLRVYNPKLFSSHYKQAAVALIICENNGSPSILFLRRSKDVKTHTGQISLPGGGVEEADKSLISTAIRETEEETGILLRESQCVGRLNDFITNSDFHLSTFVFLIGGEADVILSREHDAYFYAPLADLQNSELQKHYTAKYKGKLWDMHEYRIQNYRIWGVTGWIVNQFLSLSA